MNLQRYWSWRIVAGLLILLGGLAFAATSVQNTITIKTPRKKSLGLDTVVNFTHENHQKITECMTCHATIIQKVQHPSNTMQNVHDACRMCHKKGQSAEKFSSCTSCHVQPPE